MSGGRHLFCLRPLDAWTMLTGRSPHEFSKAAPSGASNPFREIMMENTPPPVLPTYVTIHCLVSAVGRLLGSPQAVKALWWNSSPPSCLRPTSRLSRVSPASRGALPGSAARTWFSLAARPIRGIALGVVVTAFSQALLGGEPCGKACESYIT